MYLQGNEIDALSIHPQQPIKPSDLTFYKMKLEERNEDIIDLSEEEPQFALDHIPSRMNFWKD
jgi:hypothetical protein